SGKWPLMRACDTHRATAASGQQTLRVSDQQVGLMTNAEREPAWIAERGTANGFPDGPSHQVRTALAFLVDCVYTSAGINNGEILPKAGKLRLIESAGTAESHRERNGGALQIFASNLHRAAQAIAITATHTALTQTFGDLADLMQPSLSEQDALR